MEKHGNIPNYEITKVIGSGAFGYVFEAFDTKKCQKVALKRMQKVGKISSRECEILMQLKSCPNVVKLIDVFYSRSEDNKMVQNIILEFMDQNLENIIIDHRKRKDYFDTKTLKNYLYQMLKGLDQIHKKQIAHRDLKPENVLIQDETLKLCDFGSAKEMTGTVINTPYIVSRFYRAPELLLGVTDYTESIDIWAFGCIMAELALLEPFFIGKSEGDQLFQILKIMGSFTEEDIQYFKKVVPFDINLFQEFPEYKAINLIEKFCNVEDKENFVDLLKKILRYIPGQRPTASEALQHQYFKDIIDQ